MKHLLYLIFFICSIKAIASDYQQDSNRIPANIVVEENSFYSGILPNIPEVVYGLTIDGKITIFQDDYLVRVLVVEKDGTEHLVMESYKEIHGLVPTEFEDLSEETYITNGQQLDSIKIYTCGAKLQINGMRFIPELKVNNTNTKKNRETLAKGHRAEIIKRNIERINEYNETHHLLWRADKTWLSQQDYETRKKILGIKDCFSTRGIEYYAGGIIEIDETEPIVQSLRTDTLCVDEFDWRNRHGKNWMTHVKNQGNSNCCYLFACVGAVEALTNIYFNQKLDMNLSEQELTSCSGLNFPYINGTPSDMNELPLNYLVNHGICDSLSYPFVNYPYQPCLSGSITPNELVSISGYNEVNIDENEIKKAIINHGPLVSGIRSPVWMNHSMVLVGYGVLQAGDTIYHHLWYDFDNMTYVHDKYLTIDEDDPRIGRTYMIYKNSYGLMDSDSNQGYMYVIHNNYSTSLPRTFYLETPVSSMNYLDSDIVCEDLDGDGYFNWGIGPKPSHCPSWAANEPDGDDADYTKGPMNQYGYISTINVDSAIPLIIISDRTYSTKKYLHGHCIIQGGAELTVLSEMQCYDGVKIIIKNNSTLRVKGGSIKNVHLIVEAGGHLIIEDGGEIVCNPSYPFEIPIGALLDVSHGLIH